ncbi:SDR family NAD(P)-dependent oxidoreductase [Ammoniphilus resinae]|uniref:3-oxoacyl-[acyl-carrier protein] reductase n=1 Tax=Ammoniphilus resinae TaxID=861532 RepID=A0ABS4GQX1_9BACL|nr:3-oxoacyl-ACP reductase family protein [Ammoniphilus resinae]MBP1932668.1 3-oxoacyl-[acyl-carrier protein] reductase [Ammoniphilus resinae]
MFTFQDQVVWVTGSSTGIGRAAALGFAQHGAKVIIHYNSSAQEAEELAGEIKKLGREVLLVKGDVADKNQVKEMVAQIEERFGRIDILVNNAGSLVKRARLEELEEDLWDRIMNVNLKSVYLVSQAVLPLMKLQGKGKIINVTSVAARNGGGKGSLAYAASKGGVSTLTRGMAKDLVEYNILVNAIAPGVISTPFHDRFSSPELRKVMASQIPMGREGTPEETIGSILFLASSYADYITGEIVEVNGGQLMD